MPQTLTSQQIGQYITQVQSGGVEQVRLVYDTLNAQGYNYAGWAAGVARGDSITGLSALNFLQGTALMGMGGEACRNLTPVQIDKIRVDMAEGYLQTLKRIADRSDNVIARDLDYRETEAFHKTAFEANNLTLDNWTLKTPFDLIRQTQGDAAAEKLWQNLRDAGGTGLDAIMQSTWLLSRTGALMTSTDPLIAQRAQDWMNNVPGPANWGQIKQFYEAFDKLYGVEGGPFIGNSLRLAMPIIYTLVNTLTTSALNWVEPRRDPLVLDLDGGGITTSGINPAAPILFDQDGDGTLTATGWIASGEAIVVRDLNGNGRIDSGRELFGDSTVLTRGPNIGQLAANGFVALADLDANAAGVADGKFDASDAAFASVKLWKDLNQNGVSEAGELFSFADLGVQSINLAATASNVSLGGGNTQTFAGSFTRVGGVVGSAGTAELAGSLLLANNNFYRQFTDDPVTTAAAQGPAADGG